MPVGSPEPHLHVGGELAKSLVEIVHLRQNADDYYDDENIGRRMRELVLSIKRHLQGDTKGFDRHD